MHIIHIAAECFPAAKVGGLGDVVGALPKYLSKAGHRASVIIPRYKLKWIQERTVEVTFEAEVLFSGKSVNVRILRCADAELGFELFFADIPEYFDREGIYADYGSSLSYPDDTERWLIFQRVVLLYLTKMEHLPDVVHCHDHHTGLIPFMMKCCPEFEVLKEIPSLFTIHNGVYHGAFGWEKRALLPEFSDNDIGLLDWDKAINPLAAGIKCAWKFTTVSPGYLGELKISSAGLEYLVQHESAKAFGILNGIDVDVWNPATDNLLEHQFTGNVAEYKQANKALITQRFKLDHELPLISFIGRFALEKGADLLPASIRIFLERGGKASFMILGSGDPGIRDSILELKDTFTGFFDASIQYNERLSHQLYAGSDFLVMPSRVEPCGLNQMYAFRYGTIPIVRKTGGLADTVKDLSTPEANGITFQNIDSGELAVQFERAAELYQRRKEFEELRTKIMKLDFSWERSAATYLEMYKNVVGI